jgi:hypothetical protein
MSMVIDMLWYSSGITIHWGCANDAVALAIRTLPPPTASTSFSYTSPLYSGVVIRSRL